MQHRAGPKKLAGEGGGASWSAGGIHVEEEREHDRAREMSPPVVMGLGLDESLRDRLRFPLLAPYPDVLPSLSPPTHFLPIQLATASPLRGEKSGERAREGCV